MKENDPAKRRVSITMTTDEYQVFKAYAKRREMRLGEFARMSMKSEIRRRVRDKYWLREIPKETQSLVDRAMGMIVDAGVEVYFIKDSEYIKIGISTDVEKRLYGINTDNPHDIELLASFPGSRKIEKALHAAFGFCRLRNEWFHEAPQIYDFIEAMRRKWGSVL